MFSNKNASQLDTLISGKLSIEKSRNVLTGKMLRKCGKACNNKNSAKFVLYSVDVHTFYYLLYMLQVFRTVPVVYYHETQIFEMLFSPILFSGWVYQF